MTSLTFVYDTFYSSGDLTPTASKLSHFWIQISYCSPYEAHLKKQRVVCVKKKKIAVKLKRIIFKDHTNCSLSKLHERNFFLETFNTYSFNFNGGLCKALLAFVCGVRQPITLGKQLLLYDS